VFFSNYQAHKMNDKIFGFKDDGELCGMQDGFINVRQDYCHMMC